MQGSQEGKRAKLWGPRAHFGANISMKIVSKSVGMCRGVALLIRVCLFNPSGFFREIFSV